MNISEEKYFGDKIEKKYEDGDFKRCMRAELKLFSILPEGNSESGK